MFDLINFDFETFVTKQLNYYKTIVKRTQKNNENELQNKLNKTQIELTINKRKFKKNNKRTKTKNFVIKTHDNKFDEYFDDNWYDWHRYIIQMKNQFKQNNVDVLNEKSIKNRKKIVYVETFLKFSVKTIWNNFQKNINEDVIVNYIWNEFKQF